MEDNEPQVDQPTYLMVPRKLIVTWVMSLVGMLGLVAGGIVWSNQQWCGIIQLFNETYETAPPPSPTGKLLAVEFQKMHNRFLCR